MLQSVETNTQISPVDEKEFTPNLPYVRAEEVQGNSLVHLNHLERSMTSVT